ARGRPGPSGAALVEQDDPVGGRVEVAPQVRSGPGARTAVQHHRGLAVRVAAGLPVDAVAVTDVQHAVVVRFDRRVSAHPGTLMPPAGPAHVVSVVPSPAARAAVRRTSRSISGVSRPVKVLRWLTWKQPKRSRPGPSAASRVTRAPCAKAGRGRGTVQPASANAGRAACQPKAPRTRAARSVGRSRCSSCTSQGRQASRSEGVGLLAGGAQCTGAVTRTPYSRRPSSACTEDGCEASPTSYSAWYSTSPERSPVNIR